MAKGRSLELYFVDGNPDGMQTAELFGWTGHVLLTPRTQLVQALRRDESSHTGIYILIGENDNGQLIYIGESEDIGNRLRGHAREKEWWDSAVLISSAANNLHKAHVKYLESRMFEIGQKVGKVVLENGNIPTRSSLSEAATANMEEFLSNLMIVLPALRIDAFLDKAGSKDKEAIEKDPTNSPVFELLGPKTGVNATARLDGADMVVQAGSMVRQKWVGTHSGYSALYHELYSTGILKMNHDHAVFTENYAFSSTSAAGAIVNGRATRGPDAWKLQGTKQSYADWEAEQLNSESDG